MLKCAILGPGNWARRLVGSIQGKNDEIGFTVAGSRDPDKHMDFGTDFGFDVITYGAVNERRSVLKLGLLIGMLLVALACFSSLFGRF